MKVRNKKYKDSCYHCGNIGHYKSDCPLIKKDKGKSQHKKSSKSRRAYIAWESDNESSSEDSPSDSD